MGGKEAKRMRATAGGFGALLRQPRAWLVPAGLPASSGTPEMIYDCSSYESQEHFRADIYPQSPIHINVSQPGAVKTPGEIISAPPAALIRSYQ
ncbi:hypothetical protein Q8A67_022442 [Cirrhinus molitorella]|uniref:Uncharacterized protein n=1 Tax=Cirrhinus molitorella TaxID=172907 RepID=A0AA88P434_9TELE|nr:hypothetical protein Q8A67_022442 [Cirrhinus molitorella]